MLKDLKRFSKAPLSFLRLRKPQCLCWPLPPCVFKLNLYRLMENLKSSGQCKPATPRLDVLGSVVCLFVVWDVLDPLAGRQPSSLKSLTSISIFWVSTFAESVGASSLSVSSAGRACLRSTPRSQLVLAVRATGFRAVVVCALGSGLRLWAGLEGFASRCQLGLAGLELASRED